MSQALKVYKSMISNLILSRLFFLIFFFTKMSSLLLPLFSRRSSNHHYQAIPDDNQHIEYHFESPEIIRDIVLGLSDGLTASYFK